MNKVMVLKQAEVNHVLFKVFATSLNMMTEIHLFLGWSVVMKEDLHQKKCGTVMRLMVEVPCWIYEADTSLSCSNSREVSVGTDIFLQHLKHTTSVIKNCLQLKENEKVLEILAWSEKNPQSEHGV